MTVTATTMMPADDDDKVPDSLEFLLPREDIRPQAH